MAPPYIPKIPSDASTNEKAAWEEVWKAIKALTTGDLDMSGRKIRNMGKGLMPQDAATLNQVLEKLKDPEVAKLVSQIVNTTGGPTHNLLSATHPDTSAAAPAAQDLLVGLSTAQWGRFAVGTNGSFLSVVSSALSWVTTIMGFSDNGFTVTLGSRQLAIAFNNGASVTIGYATELLNITAVTNDTAANLLPANSIIFAVLSRVTTSITRGGGNPTSIAVGDPTTAGRFTASMAVTAGTIDAGLGAMDGKVAATADGPTQAAAAKVRVTTTGGAGAFTGGAVRLISFYFFFTPPTS